MNCNITISVITTVKNGEAYLDEMLSSVYNQTIEPLEHLIIDDGSSDNTILIIENFKKKNINNKVVIISTNGIGRGEALNLAVSNAKGNWIAIVDADDIWHPEKLEVQAEIVRKNPDLHVLGTNSFLFNKNSQISFSNAVTQQLVVFANSLLKSNQLSHSSVLIKKEICQYDIGRKSQYDYELWLRLAHQGYKLALTKDYLTFHRIHPSQSFEGKMGKSYQIRSFKLKFYYSIMDRNISAILYNTIKLIFDIFFPRYLRLKIRKLVYSFKFL